MKLQLLRLFNILLSFALGLFAILTPQLVSASEANISVSTNPQALNGQLKSFDLTLNNLNPKSHYVLFVFQSGNTIDDYPKNAVGIATIDGAAGADPGAATWGKVFRFSGGVESNGLFQPTGSTLTIKNICKDFVAKAAGQSCPDTFGVGNLLLVAVDLTGQTTQDNPPRYKVPEDVEHLKNLPYTTYSLVFGSSTTPTGEINIEIYQYPPPDYIDKDGQKSKIAMSIIGVLKDSSWDIIINGPDSSAEFFSGTSEANCDSYDPDSGCFYQESSKSILEDPVEKDNDPSAWVAGRYYLTLKNHGAQSLVVRQNDPFTVLDDKNIIGKTRIYQAVGSEHTGSNTVPSPCLGTKDKPNSCLTAIGRIQTDPTGFIKDIFAIALGIAGGVAFLLMVIGAFRMITSGGNPDALNGGRELLTSAVVGLLFITFSVLLLKIIGVDILKIPGFGPVNP